jgi:hypothetical protein
MPDIGQMAWRAARRKEDDVDSHVIPRFTQIMPEDFRRRRDPAQPPLIDRQIQFGSGRTRLHLDKGEHRPLARDQIDLTRRGPHPPSDNLPALQPQPPGRDPLSLTPASFGNLAFHPFNSVARS